jgi:serine protease Do
MKRFPRLVLAYAAGCFCIVAPSFAESGQPAGQRVAPTAQDSQAFLSHSSQGYLGIASSDVDNDRVSALKLKEATGAEIVNIDRDAPACKAGLKVHDVILQLNGQPVAGDQQLRRMLRETPAGRTITLLISRDGQQQTVSVQLADRATVEQNAWTQHMIVPAPDDDDTIVLEGPSGRGFGGGSGSGSGFFGAFSLGSPSVGVELDVLGSQLADYFGIKDHQGLLVKHVAEDSPASRAGLKAGDVITTANGQKMATLGEWMKMLHANRGKQIQLTLMRNHKEETVTLEASKSKNHGETVIPDSLFMDQKIDLNGQVAQLKNLAPDTLMLQVQPSIQVKSLPDFQPMQIEVPLSVDLQSIQKQLQDEQRNDSQQLQLLQQQIKIFNLNPMDQME